MDVNQLLEAPSRIDRLEAQIALLRENMGGNLTRAYTISETAKLISISPTTVRELIRSGELKAFRLTDGSSAYRIDNHAIDDYVNRRKEVGI